MSDLLEDIKVVIFFLERNKYIRVEELFANFKHRMSREYFKELINTMIDTGKITLDLESKIRRREDNEE